MPFTSAQLASELTTDPLGLGYAALVAAGSDAGLATLINTPAYPGPVDLATISAYCLDNGITGPIVAAANEPTGTTLPNSTTLSLAIKGACRSMLTLIETNFRLSTADVTSPAFALGCEALVAAGLLTTPQQVALIALGATGRSRAEVLWGDGTTVGQADISFALRGN